MKTHPVLSEALRLFFPLAALQGALWPILWIVVGEYELPFSQDIPPSQWHAHEMIFGTYGMALAGFLLAAVPEWTDTAPSKGSALIYLSALWLTGRIVGLMGVDGLNMLAGITDVLFFAAMTFIIGRAMFARRTTKHLAFLGWSCVFTIAEAATRTAWHLGNYAASARYLEAALCIFVVLFSLSASRINVVVINLALDPTGETSPYRPHPGRRHMTGVMVAIYMVAMLLFPSSDVPAWLALAAGAAFMDRLAEWFIGSAIIKTDILLLATGNAFAGFGFLALGATRLGADIATAAGLHMISVGALGCAVMGVFIIAGLRHTGRDLVQLPWQAHAAAALVVLAAITRIVPEFNIASSFSPWHHGVSSILWSAGLCIWLNGFIPFLLNPGIDQDGTCG